MCRYDHVTSQAQEHEPTPPIPPNQPDVEAELASQGLVPPAPLATPPPEQLPAGTATHDRAVALLGAAIGEFGCPVEAHPEQIRALRRDPWFDCPPLPVISARSYGGDPAHAPDLEALLEADQVIPLPSLLA